LHPSSDLPSPCNCAEEREYSGNDIDSKVERDLIRVDFGPEFGDVLFRCKHCGQLWEKNLSRATYHDWPPLLMKVDLEFVAKKYGPRQAPKKR